MTSDKLEAICWTTVAMTFMIVIAILIYLDHKNDQKLRDKCLEMGNPPSVCAPLLFDLNQEKEQD